MVAGLVREQADRCVTSGYERSILGDRRPSTRAASGALPRRRSPPNSERAGVAKPRQPRTRAVCDAAILIGLAEWFAVRQADRMDATEGH